MQIQGEFLLRALAGSLHVTTSDANDTTLARATRAAISSRCRLMGTRLAVGRRRPAAWPPSLQTAESSGTVTRVSMTDAVSAYEKDLIQDALKTTRGNRAKAARLLDTTERVLNYKVKQLAIDYQRFKV